MTSSQPASHPGFPGYCYRDSNSKLGSMSEMSHLGTGVGAAGAMKRYGSQPSIGGHSLGSRSMLYGSRRSLYSTYTVSGMSYILPVMTKSPNPYRRPLDNWPIAFCSLFFNPLFGIFAILLAGRGQLCYFYSAVFTLDNLETVDSGRGQLCYFYIE